MITEPNTCKICRYFKQITFVGECRKLPPLCGFRNWPQIEETDWCGEHEHMIVSNELANPPPESQG